jgi:GT2 family glycosyltransferase
MSRVAVVIPSWNGEELLPGCLTSLRRQTLAPAEVVVVDDGSTDGSVEMLARTFPEVRVIRLGRHRGFAAAVNAGIRATRAGLVALLNNDAEADPGWLAALVAAAEGERVGMVASRILDAGDPRRIQGIGLEVGPEGDPREVGRGEEDGPAFGIPREVFGPIGAAALYRRELFQDVGLFDEDFFAYLEDVDLAWRARRAGWRCRYAPDAVVRHLRASTGRRIPRRVRYLLWRNHPWLLAKNAEAGTLLRFALRQPLRDAVDLGRLLAAGRATDALVLVAARAAALAGLPRMLRRRRGVGRPSAAADLVEVQR